MPATEQYPEGLSYEDAKHEFRLTNDGDHWGTAMSWLFAMCDEIHFNREDLQVPASLEFTPSPIGPDDEDRYEAQAVAAMEDRDLMRFLGIISRFEKVCVRKGLNY